MRPHIWKYYRKETGMSDLFLNDEEVVILTGRKTKSKQIEALRKMGVAFFVNAVNRPMVTRAAIEGTKSQVNLEKPSWVPAVLMPGYVAPAKEKKPK